MRNLLKLVLLIMFIFTSNSLGQNKWYISPYGSGNQSGTSKANAKIYTDINTLNIQPGDTVFVVDGTYNGQLYFRKSGTSNALITIMPDPQNTGEAVFRNTSDYAIDIRGTSYVRLKKLTIRNSGGGIMVGTGKVKYLDSLHISKNAGTGINIYGNNGGGYGSTYNPGIDSYIDSVFIRWCYVATDTQVNRQTDCITIYWGHGVRILNNYLLQGNYTGDGHNDNIQTGHGLGDIYIANNMLINLKETNSQILMSSNSWQGYKKVFYNNVAIHYGAGVGVWLQNAYNGFNTNGSYAIDGETYVINNTLIGRRIVCLSHTNDYPQGSGVFLDSTYAVNNIFYMKNSDGTTPLALPRKPTDTYNAMYVENNIFAIDGGTSTKHIDVFYGNSFIGSWSLSQWNSLSTMVMDSSTTILPTFANLLYNPSLYNIEDLRLASGSVGINAGRGNIKIKGNQWVNLKTLIESFGLPWEGFNNPYVSWANGGARSETTPEIGAVEYIDNQFLQDNDPPEVVSATIVDSITVNVTFSEPMEQSSVTNPTNYSIDNGIVVNSVQSLSTQSVRLNTSVHSPGFYTVTVNNVTDTAGNIISVQQNSFSYGYNPDPLPSLLKFVPTGTLASAVPEPEHLPEKTFDGLTFNSGDPNSRWAALGLPQWIVYDLGDIKKINKTRIQFFRWLEGRVYTYSILISTDSLNWSYKRQNIQSEAVEWNEENFEPTPGRYVKILITGNNENDWANIWETEIYGNLLISGNDDLTNVPKEFKLEQNYPNPFNPTTKIRYSIPRSTEYYSVLQKVTLKVYDILGNEIATLEDDYKSAGNYEVDFNASDIASGVYIYRLFVQDLQSKDGKNGIYTESNKMLLLR